MCAAFRRLMEFSVTIKWRECAGQSESGVPKPSSRTRCRWVKRPSDFPLPQIFFNYLLVPLLKRHSQHLFCSGEVSAIVAVYVQWLPLPPNKPAQRVNEAVCRQVIRDFQMYSSCLFYFAKIRWLDTPGHTNCLKII